MDKLINAMKRVLADSFAFYLKTANYHWNIEGPNFFQLHEYFGQLYAEVYGAIDPIAEHIRALGAYAPGSFSRFSELTTLSDETNIPADMEMVRRLLADNNKLLSTLSAAQQIADDVREVGVSNFLQDRIDIHKKHAWMLNAIVKSNSSGTSANPTL